MKSIQQLSTYLLPAVLLSIILCACNGSGSATATTSNSAKLVHVTVAPPAPGNTVVFNSSNRRLAHVGIATSNIQINIPNLPSEPVFTYFELGIDGGDNKDVSHSFSTGCVAAGSESCAYTSYTFNLKANSLVLNKSYIINAWTGNKVSKPYFFDTQSQYLIFNSGSKFTTAASSGGLASFDQLCKKSADYSHPGVWTKEYFAILGSGSPTRRAICENNISDPSNTALCGREYSTNWILQPSSAYYNKDNKLIQFSNYQAILLFPWITKVEANNEQAWVGLQDNWSMLPDRQCNHWTDPTRPSASIGYVNNVTGTALGGDAYARNQNDMNRPCHNVLQVYCAEQAQVALVQPANKDAAPITTPIEIQTGYNVNPTTVSSGSAGNFSILEEEPDGTESQVSGTITNVPNVDGTTTAVDSTNFVFTPTKPLKQGYTYKVVINGAGATTPMTSGVGNTVPYQEFTFTVQDSKTPLLVEPPVSQRFNVPESGEMFKVKDSSPNVEYALYKATPNPGKGSIDNFSIDVESLDDYAEANSYSYVEIPTTGNPISGGYTFTPNIVLDKNSVYKVCKKAYNVLDVCKKRVSSWWIRTENPNTVTKLIAPVRLAQNAAPLSGIYKIAVGAKLDPFTIESATLFKKNGVPVSGISTKLEPRKGQKWNGLIATINTPLDKLTSYEISDNGKLYDVNNKPVKFNFHITTSNGQPYLLMKPPVTAEAFPANSPIAIQFPCPVHKINIKITNLGNGASTNVAVRYNGDEGLAEADAELIPGDGYELDADAVEVNNDANVLALTQNIQVVQATQVRRLAIYEAVGNFINEPEMYTGYAGNFLQYGPQDNDPITHADWICNNDFNKPADTQDEPPRTFRAMIVSPNRRYPPGHTLFGPFAALDWVLMANHEYYRSDLQTLIGTTNLSRILTNLQNPIRPPQNEIDYLNADGNRMRPWTGMNEDWSVSDRNCGRWSADEGDFLGNIGDPYSLLSTQVAETMWDQCGFHNTIYCAEQ